jgi:hypothetical protein
MATVLTLKTNILRTLLDPTQNNYLDAEIWAEMNKGLETISKELAKWNSKVDLQNTTLTFSALAYSDTSSVAALNPAFLSLAQNEKGEQKIFNVTQTGKPRLTMAQESDIDDWESETDSDDGVPNEYYFRGLNIYIHPRPTVQTQIKFYYNPLRTITNDSSTMPWGSLFDSALEQFVIAKCRMRTELMAYNPQLDISITENLRRMSWDILFQREGMTMNFATGVGWNN